jgi:hypothetical protein
VDEGSGLLSETEGAPLFAAEGQPGPVLDNVKRYLAELHQLDQLTIPFSRTLAEMNLLVPLQLRLNDSGRLHTIAGCYVVNEAGLQGLAAEQFLLLREKNYLPAIYAHLLSLLQVERLTTLRQERVKTDQVVSVPATLARVQGEGGAPAVVVPTPQSAGPAAPEEKTAPVASKSPPVMPRKVVTPSSKTAPALKATGEPAAKSVRATKKKSSN